MLHIVPSLKDYSEELCQHCNDVGDDYDAAAAATFITLAHTPLKSTVVVTK